MKKLFTLLLVSSIMVACISCDVSKPSRPTNYSHLSPNSLAHDAILDFEKSYDKYVGDHFIIFARIDYLSSDKKSFSASPQEKSNDITIQIVGDLNEVIQSEMSLISANKTFMLKGTITNIECDSPSYVKIIMTVYEVAEW